MPDQDDRLPAELREYYRQLERRPAPDVTGRVMAATDLRASRMRTWGAVGVGLLAAAGAAAVVVLALANHKTPVSVAPSSTAPVATTAPLTTSTPTTVPAVVAGPAVHGFVPSDVTAVSAGQWWVLGYNGPQCSSPSCTRILHTVDGGATFASIPVPPVSPATTGQQADLLRFDDPSNGWLVSELGAVWATHDGGSTWSRDTGAGTVTDLAASSGTVYAVACVPVSVSVSSCTLERSFAGEDVWTVLSASAGHGQLGSLNVNGSHVWVALDSPGGGPGRLLSSSDGGQHFTTGSVCPGALGTPHLYAVNTGVLWATCATGTEASAFRSTDGGQHFTQVQAPGLPNFASIAGVSSATAVVGSLGLLRTTDGGLTFATVTSTSTQWSIVGFTTSSNGFAIQLDGQTALSGPGLWRTNDAGAHWYQVQFP